MGRETFFYAPPGSGSGMGVVGLIGLLQPEDENQNADQRIVEDGQSNDHQHGVHIQGRGGPSNSSPVGIRMASKDSMPQTNANDWLKA